MLSKRAKLDPDRPALIFEGRTFSFQKLNERSNCWANAFAGLGAKKGDRVGILLRNCSEFLEACFGLAKIGAIVVLLNWRLTPSELQHICRDSGITCLIYEEEFSSAAEMLRSNLALDTYVRVGQSASPAWARDLSFIYAYPVSEPTIAASDDDPVLIAYTSGTTGRPKGVVFTHRIIFGYVVSWLMAADVCSQDRILAVLPLSHAFSLTCPVMLDVYKGCTTVLMKVFEPQHVLETLLKEKVTTLICAPVMLKRLSEIPNFERYLAGVRIIVGAGVLTEPLMKTCVERGIRLRTTYGLTEAGCVSVMSSDMRLEKPGTGGQSFFHTDIRLVDEDGWDLPPNEIGEVLVRGPTVMKEYWNDPQSTAEKLRDGWLHTGDLAQMDTDGYIYIVGRKNDMIFSGGEQIYPSEVESVLEAHPKIAESAVIGLPDETWGESPCAVVRPKRNQKLTADEVAEYCRGRLAGFKIPKRVFLVDSPLPRDTGGKLLKRVLRNQLGLSAKV